jgi:hypothetical protein
MEYREPSHPARAGRFSRCESIFLVTVATLIAATFWWRWDWQAANVYDNGVPIFVMPCYARLLASVGAGAFGALILFGLFHMIRDAAKRIRRSAKKSD